jgi:Spy/CpxP family protein refolding chaperone
MRFRATTLALLLPLLPACKNCGGKTEPVTTGATDASASATASAVPTASGSARPQVPHVRASGITGMLFRSLREIELRDDQRTAIEAIATDLRAAAADAGASENSDLRNELVNELKAGKVEPAKLDAHYAALERSVKAREAREDEALDKLYATLDPAQRKALVASARTVVENRGKHVKERNEDGGASAPYERMTRRLELDPEQKKKIDGLAPKVDRFAAQREQMQKHSEAILAAFEKDGFDAKTIDSGAAKQARAMEEDQAKFLAQIVGILKPPQRERLARQLSGHGRGEGGGGGHPRPSHEDDDDMR